MSQRTCQHCNKGQFIISAKKRGLSENENPLEKLFRQRVPFRRASKVDTLITHTSNSAYWRVFPTGTGGCHCRLAKVNCTKGGQHVVVADFRKKVYSMSFHYFFFFFFFFFFLLT
jgi:hypothetical protein